MHRDTKQHLQSQWLVNLTVKVWFLGATQALGNASGHKATPSIAMAGEIARESPGFWGHIDPRQCIGTSSNTLNVNSPLSGKKNLGPGHWQGGGGAMVEELASESTGFGGAPDPRRCRGTQTTTSNLKGCEFVVNLHWVQHEQRRENTTKGHKALATASTPGC